MATNIKFPLRRGRKGAFETNDDTITAIIDDLRILLLTNHGERPIQFDFGANLRAVIFEQGSDVKQKIDDNIRFAVDKWMPFVTISIIDVRTFRDDVTLKENQVHIKIDFLVGQLRGVLNQRVSA